MHLGGFLMSEKELKEYRAREEAAGFVFYESKVLDPADLEPEEVIPRRAGIPVSLPTYYAPHPLTFPGSGVPLDGEPDLDVYEDYLPDSPSLELSKASEAEASQEDDGHECDDDEDHDKGKEQQQDDFGTKPEAKGKFILKRHRQDIDPAMSSSSTASGTKPEAEGKSILKRHHQDIDLAISTASGTKP